MGCCTSSVGALAVTKKKAALGLAPRNGNNNLTISSEEKRVVKKTWTILSQHLSELGVKIFLRIFELDPHVQKLFKCRDLTGDALLQDPNFKGHSYRFVQAVGAAVDNIDDLDEALAPLLLNLGRQHVHYTGFRRDYMDSFSSALLDVFKKELGDRYTQSVAMAWTNVLDFINDKLREGYSSGAKEAHKGLTEKKQHA